MMTKRDALYKCTSNKIWICMIEGRMLVNHRGRAAWSCKSGAALAFLNSSYWNYVKYNEENPKKLYKELLKNGTVKYIELTPIPDGI